MTASPGRRSSSRTARAGCSQLDDGADDQAVLRAALATGPVREFRRDRPALTQLFRDVMSGKAIDE